MLILLPILLHNYVTVIPQLYNNMNKFDILEMLTYDVVLILMFAAVLAHIITKNCLKLIIFQCKEMFPFLKF